MVYVFLAEGFEETEAIVPTDILRRGGVQTLTVGVTGKTVTGAHGIPVTADIEIKDASFEGLHAIILPGGSPGTRNLKHNEQVQSFVDYAAEKGILLCAICAAPAIPGHKGLLKGKKAVCYPGLESHLRGAEVQNAAVVKDGNIITSKGPGTASDFGFAVLKALKGGETSGRVYKEMCF